MKPILEIPSGCLRPAEVGDAAASLKLLRDPEVRRYLCDDRVLAPGEVARMLAESAALDPRGLGLWRIEAPRGQVSGLVGLTPVSPEMARIRGMAGGIEPVIALAPEGQGRGVAREALGAVLEHARTALGLDCLVAAVDAPNARSHRLLRSCGFAAFGRAEGPAHPLVLYAAELSASR